jgi:hypothetical protein
MAKRDDAFRGFCWRLAGPALLALGCTAQVQTEAEVADEQDPPPDTVAPTQAGDTSEGEPATPVEQPLLVEQGPPGTITVIYRRRQITACAMQDEEGEKVCAPKSDKEHQGKADIVLMPVDADGEEDRTRMEVVIAFEDGQAEQTREVELAAGRWELEWKGESIARDAFKVVSKDRFEITLEGIAGMCTQEGKTCKLEAQKNQQVIELPEVRGLR